TEGTSCTAGSGRLVSKDAAPPLTFANTVWIMSSTIVRSTLAPGATTSGLVKNVCAVSTSPWPPGPGTTNDTNCESPAGGVVESPVGDAGSEKKACGASLSMTSNVVPTPTPTPPYVPGGTSNGQSRSGESAAPSRV